VLGKDRQRHMHIMVCCVT